MFVFNKLNNDQSSILTKITNPIILYSNSEAPIYLLYNQYCDYFFFLFKKKENISTNCFFLLLIYLHIIG